MKVIEPYNIHLIVYDFDGVMTDNRAIVMQDGTEAVVVNRADGLGVDFIRKAGIPQLILSTESNPVVQARGRKLKIDVVQNCGNKKEALIEICSENGYDISKVVFIGNDLNDLEVMKIAGFTFCPSDAHNNIINITDHILKAKGGDGVVRELLDLLTNKKGE